MVVAFAVLLSCRSWLLLNETKDPAKCDRLRCLGLSWCGCLCDDAKRGRLDVRVCTVRVGLLVVVRCLLRFLGVLDLCLTSCSGC